MTFEDQKIAQRALEIRLADWGIPDAPAKARAFMDELVRRGWQMAPERETRPRPPRTAEACRDCGKHVDACLCETGPMLRPTEAAPDVSARVLDLRRNVAPIRGASGPTTTEGA